MPPITTDETETALRKMRADNIPGETKALDMLLADRALMTRFANTMNRVLAPRSESRACTMDCLMSFGEGTRDDPDRCTTCNALFLRDALIPFGYAE